MQKICKQCGLVKNKFRHQCATCYDCELVKNRARYHSRYKNNPNYIAHQNKSRIKYRPVLRQRRRDIKERLIVLFGGKCICCGYNAYSGALDFHHRDRKEKKFSLSKHYSNHCSSCFDMILEEAKKCDLVCSNCHREIEGGFRIIQKPRDIELPVCAQ